MNYISRDHAHLHGVKVSIDWSIGGNIKKMDAIFSIENGRAFICQNYKQGNYCKERFGFRYSWVLQSFDTVTSGILEYEGIVNIRFGGEVQKLYKTLLLNEG